MENLAVKTWEAECENEEGLTELEMAGINPNHLGYMGEKERREVLEAAGLDPDAFDF